MTYLLIGGIGKLNSKLRHYVVSVTHGGWMLFWHKSKYSSLNIGLTPWRRAAVFSHPATVRKDKYKKIRVYSIGVCILAASDRNTYIYTVRIFWFSFNILALVQVSRTSTLLYIFFPFFIFLKKRSKWECQCLVLWETCLLYVDSGQWRRKSFQT